METRTRFGVVILLMFALLVGQSGSATAGEKLSSKTVALLQELVEPDAKQVAARADVAESSLEDLLRRGQPEADKGDSGCGTKPGSPDQLAQSCSIRRAVQPSGNFHLAAAGIAKSSSFKLVAALDD
jgi:hypothetical protein